MELSETRMAQLDSLQDRIKFKFSDIKLLNKALTHRSYANENSETLKHNERLEFLGDSVFDILVSDYLVHEYSEFAEGTLSKIRAAVVNETCLAKLAKNIKLGNYLLLGRGEDLSGGREKASILADTFEALAGAVFCDGRFDAASNIFLPLLIEEITKTAQSWSFRDFKSDLQEYTQNKLVCIPSYRVVREIGPDHAKKFEVVVMIKNEVEGKGFGRSKKEAEQAAAKMAIENFSHNS
jgi:ribonuclease-3